MKWATTILTVGVMALAGGLANADDVTPDNVKFEDGMVSMSLTGVPGDAAEGAKTFANRGLGNCLACHAVAELSSELFHGDVGPELDGAGDRWSEAELRAIVIDSKQVFGEETVMPGFYSLHTGVNVRKDLVGMTILQPQQVEDVVAFLTTLKD
jgi:L-cysteine S-thiosulfotransferase